MYIQHGLRRSGPEALSATVALPSWLLLRLLPRLRVLIGSVGCRVALLLRPWLDGQGAECSADAVACDKCLGRDAGKAPDHPERNQ